jgi:hypothetical protein
VKETEAITMLWAGVTEPIQNVAMVGGGQFRRDAHQRDPGGNLARL